MSEPLKSHELRDRFLAFFKDKEHVVVPSDSLIPSGDPTVLFTSAGMNQFKDAFLGKRTDLRRAASCQKCLRAGDLDRVGKSASHHTFFEMLGNFSFGDYFKREAIQWAWEFLTGTLDVAGTRRSPHADLCLSLPAGKLWVSIYEQDNEAHDLWRALGVPEERIVRFGQEDNFWPSNAPKDGPNGPCGPCSEIYFDADGKVNGPRSVEVWNLVFTQFNRLDGGTLEPLPRKNIDTGMGLERLTSVVQNVETDYETDLFRPIMDEIHQRQPKRLTRDDQLVFAERAVADHLRAIVFLLADGLLPSNESRGYVLRMLIRRAHRLARRARLPDGSPTSTSPARLANFGLIDSIIRAMENSPYESDLRKKREHIQSVLYKEEEQFAQTLESGTNRLDEVIQRLKKSSQSTISGDEVFKLYDTYGFPLELTVDIAQEHGMAVDQAGFKTALAAQQERSRASSRFGEGIFVPTTLKLAEGVRSEFVREAQPPVDGRIKGIWKGDAWVNEAHAGDEVGIVLDRSPFYGESGGQIGDRGLIESSSGQLEVIDTKWVEDLLVHYTRVRRGSVSVEQPARSHVDADHRLKVARSHTAAHLLHAALREVLGPETVQAGSFVEVERVRFDFSSLKGLHEEQRAQVEQLVNRHVLKNESVSTDVMPLEQAKRIGALALFGEKYGQQVRVVSIGGYSHELCGGTHLQTTVPVGLFRIVAESSIAAGTRRVEALVGESATQRQQQDAQWLGEIAQRLSRPPQESVQGLEHVLAQLRGAQAQIKSLKTELAQVRSHELLAQAQHVDGAVLICAQIAGADREFLAALADALRSGMAAGVAVLVSVPELGSVAWVMAVTEDLTKRGVHAGKLLKTIAAITQGGGGGRPDFAQAGGKDPSKIDEALRQAERLVREALSERLRP